MSQGLRGVVAAVVTSNRTTNAQNRRKSDRDVVQDDAKITLPDGSRFRGRVLNGAPLSGVMMHADGSRYKGTFLQYKHQGNNDYLFVRHGTGTLIYPNGDEYEGTFVEGNIVGEGRFTVFADRTVYSGFFGLPIDGDCDGAEAEAQGEKTTVDTATGGAPDASVPPASSKWSSTPSRSGAGVEYRGVETAAGFKPVPALEAERPPSPPLLHPNKWLLTGEGEVTWRPIVPERDRDQNKGRKGNDERPVPPELSGAAGLGGRLFRGSFCRGAPVGDSCELEIEPSSGARQHRASFAALSAARVLDEQNGRAAAGGFGTSFVGGLGGLGRLAYTGPLSPLGHPHGRGRLQWSGGQAILDFVEGIPHGAAEIHGGASHLGDGLFYEGPMERGVRRGRGVAVLRDGSHFEGGFEADAFAGHGTMRHPDGVVYRGGFLRGQRHGRGSLELPGGTTFDGFWRAGKRHGRGVTISAQGERLEACYAHDALAGPSRFFFRKPLTPHEHSQTGPPLLATFSDADHPVRLLLRAVPTWVLAERRRALLPRALPRVDVSLCLRSTADAKGRLSWHVKLNLQTRRGPPGAVGAFLSLRCTPPSPEHPAAPPSVHVSLALFAFPEATSTAYGGWGCGAHVTPAPWLEWSDPHTPEG